MSPGFSRLGILALAAAVMLTLGVFRPGLPTDTSEASIATPGGIVISPSAFPAIPYLQDQIIPGIMPASGPGARALVTVICHVPSVAGAQLGCPGNGNVDFAVVDSVFGKPPPNFAVTGMPTLSCVDNTSCDLEPLLGVVTVQLNGSGQDDMYDVLAVDATGDYRVASVVTVQSMLALPPLVEPYTQIIPGLTNMAMVLYRCPDVGRAVFTVGGAALVDNLNLWNRIVLNMWAVPALIPSGNDFFRCGGDTGTTADDFVSFITDVGILSVDPLQALLAGAGGPVPLSLAVGACDTGKNVVVEDTEPLPVPIGPGFVAQGCSLSGAPIGVVGYLIQSGGQTGVATITGMQATLGASTRTTNVNFIAGPAAGLVPTILLYKGELTIAGPGETPDVCDVSTGQCFKVETSALPTEVYPGTSLDVVAQVINQDLNPVQGITVVCSVDPPSGAIALAPDRDTTGLTGQALIGVAITGLPGTEVTLTCRLDGFPDIPAATHTFTLSIAPEQETVGLIAGCNPVASTWPDGTDVKTIAAAVAPEDALVSIWAFDTATGTWAGYSPTAPAGVSDLTEVDRLDAIFICVDASATLTRPVI